MRYGRINDKIDPAQVPVPAVGQNIFQSILDDLYYSKDPTGTVVPLGGGTPPTLQEVTTEGNSTTDTLEVDVLTDQSGNQNSKLLMQSGGQQADNFVYLQQASIDGGAFTINFGIANENALPADDGHFMFTMRNAQHPVPHWSRFPSFADDAAAGAAGLVTGDCYVADGNGVEGLGVMMVTQ